MRISLINFNSLIKNILKISPIKKTKIKHKSLNFRANGAKISKKPNYAFIMNFFSGNFFKGLTLFETLNS